jgi:hypothetical protein
MKVKVSKTIDINQVPGEARRMLDRAKNDLMYGLPEQMSLLVRASLSSEGAEFFSTIDLIDMFRRNLATFDENLQEVQTVLVGYKNAVSPPVPEQDPEQEYSQDWLDEQEATYEKREAQSGTGNGVEYEEG